MLWTTSGWREHSWFRSRPAPHGGERTNDPLRESEHQNQDDDAKQGAPIFGLAHDRILQRGEYRRAHDRPGERLDAAEQHHDQPVDRTPNMDRFRRNRALGKSEKPAGYAANTSGNGEAKPVHAFPVDADRFRAQRRIPARSHAVAERRKQEAPQQQYR